MGIRDITALLSALAMLTVALACGGHTSDPSESVETDSALPAEGEGQKGSGTVVAGFIRRDPDTRRDIDASSEVSLSGFDPRSLSFVVTKSRYRLDVKRGDETLKTFPVAFGERPEGTKRRQGDEQTPEGRYTLIPHHPSPSFGTCFYICYPNETDADRALAEGFIGESVRRQIVDRLASGTHPPHDTVLGGLILLHGTKQGFPGQTSTNWTDGCIAMRNDDLAELLALYGPADRPVLLIHP